ncbi:hypothetical protein ACQ4PT_060073 [Festuca glaucescens]
MDESRWPGVAPDVLRHIAGRLHDAADFVRFHAACKPWRDSRDVPPSSPRTTTQFLPWLLAPADKDSTAPLKLRCIFSRSSYRVPAPPPHPMPRRNWISMANGTAVRYMSVEHLRPSLHDPINGEDITDLPRFLWDEGDPHGIVYGDGTILLYSVHHDDGTARFRAALLRRPGKAKWTLVKRTFEDPTHGVFCVAYHRGKILVTFEATLWHVITPDIGCVSGDVLVPRPPRLPVSFPTCKHLNSYVLESRGELLWVSVDACIYHSSCQGRVCLGPVRSLSLSVHMLQEEPSLPEKMRWVKKDYHSLADRVLFLGSPNSFAIDASQLGGHGGFAFFVYSNSNPFPSEQFGVFKYNLINRKIKFVERLPPGWGYDKCMWLIPHPAISPVQEIATRTLTMATELKQQQTVTSPTRIGHMVRHYEPSITVLVRNLPLPVKSSELQLFIFSNHGKVSHTKIIYYENTKTWQAILTITTVHAHHEEALHVLDGLVLDGCRLEVSLVKEENRRRRHGRVLQE